MTAVLVETAAWLNPFCQGNVALKQLLTQDTVLWHPWMLYEIACGRPPAHRPWPTLKLVSPFKAAKV